MKLVMKWSQKKQMNKNKKSLVFFLVKGQFKN